MPQKCSTASRPPRDTKVYLTGELITHNVVSGLTPLLNAAPAVRADDALKERNA